MMKLLISTPHAMGGDSMLQVYMGVVVDDIDPEFESVRAQIQAESSRGLRVGAIWYPFARSPGIFTYCDDSAQAIESALIAAVLSAAIVRIPQLQYHGGSRDY